MFVVIRGVQQRFSLFMVYVNNVPKRFSFIVKLYAVDIYLSLAHNDLKYLKLMINNVFMKWLNGCV